MNIKNFGKLIKNHKSYETFRKELDDEYFISRYKFLNKNLTADRMFKKLGYKKFEKEPTISGELVARYILSNKNKNKYISFYSDKTIGIFETKEEMINYLTSAEIKAIAKKCQELEENSKTYI